MNDSQTSSVQTGAVTLTATSLIPVISWLAPSIPMEVVAVISASLMSLAHAGYNVIKAQIAAKQAKQSTGN